MRSTSARRAGLASAVVGGLLAAVAVPPAASAAPDLTATSWYLNAMHVRQAQQDSTGQGVTVAVLDSGVNQIPELSGRVLPGFDPGGGDGRRDRDGHGTSMAALIAGAGGGSDRLLGVAPRARILPVYAIQGERAAPLPQSTIVRLVHYAIDHGARVVNMSFTAPDSADPPDAPWKRDLVRYATKHDAVLVSGTGNDPNAPIGRPADVPGVVAVSGLARDGTAWSGSTTGRGTVVAAPAQDITFPTGVPGKRYQTASGTSGATALVSGVLALIMSRYPGISSADAINRLIRTTRDLGAEGRDPVYGYGAVDAAAAVTATVPKANGNPLLAGTGRAASARPADDANSGLSTAVLVAVIAVAALLILVLIVVIVTLRSRRRGGGSNGGGGGGGGGPGGPPSSGPGGGPIGYAQPQVPPQWQRPKEPVPAGRWGDPPP